MPKDPIYGEVEVLTPAEQQAHGLPPPPGLFPTPQLPGARPVTGSTPSSVLSSPKGFYGPGLLANLEARRTGQVPEAVYAKRVPQLETVAGLLGAMLAPGKTLATQALSQAGIAGGLKGLSGAGPLKSAEAAGGAALGQVGGGLLTKGLGRAVSSLQLPRYETKIVDSIVQKLGAEVPPWKGLPGLKDMLFSQNGWNRLHRFYDQSLKEVVKKGEKKVIQVSLDEAKALGIKDVIASADPTVATVGINAGQAAEAVTGKWTKNPKLYARIVGALDEAGVGNPADRKAYKTAMGLRAYMVKQGAVRPDGSLDLLKAQAGLVKGKSVDELLRRGLGEFDTLIMPRGQAIQKGSLQAPLALMGGALGAAGGHQFGLVPVGGLFGAYHGARLGSRIPTYSLPPGPIQRGLQQAGSRLGAVVGSQAAPLVGP